MSAPQILAAFIVLVVINAGFEIFLDVLNLRYVAGNRASIPKHFADFVDRETYDKAANYTQAKGKFSVFSTVYTSAVLIAIVAGGGFGAIDRLVGSFSSGYTRGVLFVLILSFVFSLTGIPLSLYSTFVIEERFGFNKTTPALWIKDLLKGLALSAVLLGPLLYAILWFMETAGANWWIYASIFVTLFQVLILYLFPVIIAPLFNKFTPLEDGDLRRQIDSLAERVRFHTSGIFLMDGSRRSSHGNAYFAGFGRNKRIVLFDTLIENLKNEEIVAVLAHEIGHEKRQHIKKSLVLSVSLTFVAFWILSRLAGYAPFFQAFGFDSVTSYGALTIFAFASGPIVYFLSPIFSSLSRRFEYQADRFAVDVVGGAKSLISALITLSKKSLSNLTPHPLYSFFHYSHPTLSERISAMERYASKGPA